MNEATKQLIKDIVNKFYGRRATVHDSPLSLISDFEIWLINYIEKYKIAHLNDSETNKITCAERCDWPNCTLEGCVFKDPVDRTEEVNKESDIKSTQHIKIFLENKWIGKGTNITLQLLIDCLETFQKNEEFRESLMRSELAQRDERIKHLELIMSGKTFFDEKEVMQLEIDNLKRKLALFCE